MSLASRSSCRSRRMRWWRCAISFPCSTPSPQRSPAVSAVARPGAARPAPFHVMDRVQAIEHHDDRAFAPLADCQAKARALQKEIAASAATDSEMARWAERLRPFADLLDMLEDESVVDDERFTQLAD